MSSAIKIRSDRSYGALKTGLFMVGVGLGLFVAFSITERFRLTADWDIVACRFQVFKTVATVYCCSVLIMGAVGLLFAFLIEHRMRRCS